MSARRLVLASASPARLAVLRAAGLAPDVLVTGVAEDDVVGPPGEVVRALARRKAEAGAAASGAGALVLGCDSLLDVDGVGWGKAATPPEAVARWRALRGRSATLTSGHCIVDVAADRSAEAVATAEVTFGSPTDAEIAAYAATDEALRVAGSFTIEGYAAPFVARVDGHPSTVLGCSLPVVRDLLAQLGVEITDLWV